MSTDAEMTPTAAEKKAVGVKAFQQFKDLVSSKIKVGGRVAVFTHPSPDPDAIGSQMGMAWLLKKVYDATWTCSSRGRSATRRTSRWRNCWLPS
jgi:c-di-AMP phosphodiesterase-like protein